MSTACTLLSSLFLSWIKATRSLEDKTVCTWKMYLTYCPRHGCKWGCIQFGSPGSPLSPITIPVSPHLLRILMWAVLTRSIVFQKHCPHGFLALGMEKSGGKKKGWFFRLSRATEETGNKCCVSGHSHALQPGLGAAWGACICGADTAFESNSSLWQPDSSTDGNVSFTNAFRDWHSHNINSGGEGFSQLCRCWELQCAHVGLTARRAALPRMDSAPSFPVPVFTWYCSDEQKWSTDCYLSFSCG